MKRNSFIVHEIEIPFKCYTERMFVLDQPA